jgi:hypothetical protein
MSPGKHFDMTGPVVCEIRVKGTLSPSWQEWFEPLVISAALEQDQAILVLAGCLPDQAALHGTLQKLYALGMPLISVQVGA